MGWLQRLFGQEKPENADVNATAAPDATDPSTGGEIPPERVGLNGEYDQSGLAKRVALAFDQDSSLTDIDTLWVAQTSGTVVLKGSVPSQEVLDQMVAIAGNISGATGVDTNQVQVG
jgi:osmotically-inducible protein OsmY